MALKGHLCEVKLISSGVVMTDEATTASGDLTYQITSTSKRLIDLNTDLVVKDGGSVTSEKYTVNYLEGIITFDTAVSRTITVTGAYATPTTVATADSYNFVGSGDTLENTNFKANFRSYQAGLRTGSIDLTRFHVSDSLFINQLLNSEIVLIEILVDPTHSIFAYGVQSKDAIDGPNEGLVKESVSYQLTTQIGVS